MFRVNRQQIIRITKAEIVLLNLKAIILWHFITIK